MSNLQSVLVKAWFKNDGGDLVSGHVRLKLVETGFDTDKQEEFADIEIKFGAGWEEVVTFWTNNDAISAVSGNRFPEPEIKDNKDFINGVCELAGWEKIN